jgi:hypothetical protein
MLQIIAVWALTAQAAPTIDVDGRCPNVTIRVTGATPEAGMTFYTGALGGETTLVGGVCAGTRLDLRGANAPENLLHTNRRIGSDGATTLAPGSLGERGCMKGVQVVDHATCEVSDVEPLDTGDCRLEEGLLAYWPANGDTLDIVGGHDGVVEGTVEFEHGYYGDAFVLDGWSAVKVRPYRDLDFGYGQPFTYAMWVYNERTRAEAYHIFGKRHLCGRGASFDYQYLVQSGRQGLLTYDCGATAVPRPPSGEWQHIVAGYDGSAFFVYVDGELVATSPMCAEEEMPVLGGELRIGSSGTCGTINHQGFVGLVDEVMLWNRALTEDEVECAAGPALRID